MAKKKIIKRSDLRTLDNAIAKRYPKLPKKEIQKMRTDLLRKIASAISKDAAIAIVKNLGDEKTQVTILKLFDE